MPDPLSLTLVLGCVFGALWPLFNALAIFTPPSLIQVVVFGELGAVLYGLSNLPPQRRIPKAAAVIAFVAAPVLVAMLFR